jgi:hypothetical protein
VKWMVQVLPTNGDFHKFALRAGSNQDFKSILRAKRKNVLVTGVG